jgi:hypothetical protein
VSARSNHCGLEVYFGDAALSMPSGWTRSVDGGPGPCMPGRAFQPSGARVERDYSPSPAAGSGHAWDETRRGPGFSQLRVIPACIDRRSIVRCPRGRVRPARSSCRRRWGSGTLFRRIIRSADNHNPPMGARQRQMPVGSGSTTPGRPTAAARQLAIFAIIFC